MFLRLGIRRGELLALKVPGINWQTRSVSINRMADDPEDPRTSQPKVKGWPVPASVSRADDWIHQYIRGARRQTKGANRHLFLFVVHQGPHDSRELRSTQRARASVTDRELPCRLASPRNRRTGCAWVQLATLYRPLS